MEPIPAIDSPELLGEPCTLAISSAGHKYLFPLRSDEDCIELREVFDSWLTIIGTQPPSREVMQSAIVRLNTIAYCLNNPLATSFIRFVCYRAQIQIEFIGLTQPPESAIQNLVAAFATQHGEQYTYAHGPSMILQYVQELQT